MRKLLVGSVFIACVLGVSACGQNGTDAAKAEGAKATGEPKKESTAEEKYEAVAIADYQPNMELSGRLRWDKDGLANGGPVKSFSFWGQKLELTTNMIVNGFVSTKDFGKILIMAIPTFSMRIELTPSQQKKLKQLKK